MKDIRPKKTPNYLYLSLCVCVMEAGERGRGCWDWSGTVCGERCTQVTYPVTFLNTLCTEQTSAMHGVICSPWEQKLAFQFLKLAG